MIFFSFFHRFCLPFVAVIDNLWAYDLQTSYRPYKIESTENISKWRRNKNNKKKRQIDVKRTKKKKKKNKIKKKPYTNPLRKHTLTNFTMINIVWCFTVLTQRFFHSNYSIRFGRAFIDIQIVVGPLSFTNKTLVQINQISLNCFYRCSTDWWTVLNGVQSNEFGISIRMGTVFRIVIGVNCVCVCVFFYIIQIILCFNRVSYSFHLIFGSKWEKYNTTNSVSSIKVKFSSFFSLVKMLNIANRVDDSPN